MIQRHVVISGKVQGVGFRAATLREAHSFPDLCGFVCNLPDGRVEAVFAGVEEEVLRMVEWCRSGPSLARVERLTVKEEFYDSSMEKFQIR